MFLRTIKMMTLYINRKVKWILNRIHLLTQIQYDFILLELFLIIHKIQNLGIIKIIKNNFNKNKNCFLIKLFFIYFSSFKILYRIIKFSKNNKI